MLISIAIPGCHRIFLIKQIGLFMRISWRPNISVPKGLLLKLFLIGQLVFLSGCVSNAALIKAGKIYPGMTKNELNRLNILTNQFQHPFAITATRKFYRGLNLEIIAPADKSMYFVFQNVTIPSNPSLLSVHDGNGVLDSYYSSLSDAELRVSRIVQARVKRDYGGIKRSDVDVNESANTERNVKNDSDAVLRDEFSRLPFANRLDIKNYLSDIGLYNASTPCCGYTKAMGAALTQYRDAYHPELNLAQLADVVILLDKVTSAEKAL